ncbi:hypothetical protein Sinac_1676 [Singulisphaera acidiphila DSM 18658]|uniref:Uncharacterized protein n=1 Tax=Singulisphaera acidiphila (strain ATCC BAA-1392 / DSM 18658 / VKM B-2454 / MOB10) TaxID=886293 RepID=L0D9X9_SINAD|nr:hypothetical protein Sinac_1676 [Singulisphaera acidiphila DSM 18658]
MPTLILRGGPFDGHVVESASDDTTVPLSIGLHRTGATAAVAVANPDTLPAVEQWTIRNSSLPPENSDLPVAHYQGARTTDTDGHWIFDFSQSR